MLGHGLTMAPLPAREDAKLPGESAIASDRLFWLVQQQAIDGTA